MLISCWSVKGGSGTTVVAAALALALTRSGSAPTHDPVRGRRRSTSSGTTASVTLADLAGDLPAALGLPVAGDTADGGLSAWLAAGSDVPEGALDRLAVDVTPGLTLLPRGGPLPPGDGTNLVAAFASRGLVVADCGLIEPEGPAWAVAAEAQQSFLVIRPCYLALRRAAAMPLRPSGVVLVSEPGRALTRDDVEAVLGVPVRIEVPWHESVARAVDAGLLASRLPRMLQRAFRAAA